jgi:uncharacterized 2Fe-2S/4Fe-4S cluster protein (DUF4445 family)
MAAELLAQNNIEPSLLSAYAACGNSTMCHLLLNLDPSGLAVAPFSLAYSGPYTCPAGQVGFALAPRATLYCLPCIAGHVGADITADLLAVDNSMLAISSLLIDIGTNGEICASHNGQILVCSTAAGPAFEGATIRQGMRAATGAIERVRLTSAGEVQTAVIGGQSAAGICGSGLIDAVAVLLRLGIIDTTGRFLPADETGPLGLAPSTAARLRTCPQTGQPSFVLDWGDGGEAVAITQGDVREVQLAKGAIAAGITLLLDKLGLAARKLDCVLLAGVFGNHMDLKSAQVIGLIPNVSPGVAKAVGNTALAGTAMCLLSDDARNRAAKIAAHSKHLELSQDPGFMDAYMQAMYFERM